MLKICLPLLLLGPLLLQLAEGCGRTPVTKPQVDVKEATTITSENTEQHRLNCTDDEYMSQGCLKGTCFVVVIDKVRETHCQCPPNFSGKRCEYFDPDIGLQGEGGDRIATASVAVIVVVAVLCVTVVILIVVWRVRYMKLKKERDQKDKEKLNLHAGANGTTSVHHNSRPPLVRECRPLSARYSQAHMDGSETIPLTTILVVGEYDGNLTS